MEEKDKLIQQNIKLKSRILELNAQLAQAFTAKEPPQSPLVPDEHQEIKLEVKRQNATIAKLKERAERLRTRLRSNVQVLDAKDLRSELVYLRKQEEQLELERETVNGMRRLKQDKVEEQRRSSGLERVEYEMKAEMEVIQKQSTDIKQQFVNFFRGFMKGEPAEGLSPPEKRLIRSYADKCATIRAEIADIQSKWQSIIAQEEKRLTELRDREKANVQELQQLARLRKRQSREIAFKQKISKKIESFYKKKEVLEAEAKKSERRRAEQLSRKAEEEMAAKRRWLMPPERKGEVGIGTDD